MVIQIYRARISTASPNDSYRTALGIAFVVFPLIAAVFSQDRTVRRLNYSRERIAERIMLLPPTALYHAFD
eukprot:scaffold85546_cov16-Prasinocladus_malaysianus.AAC.2